jgi:hypothetical protein
MATQTSDPDVITLDAGAVKRLAASAAPTAVSPLSSVLRDPAAAAAPAGSAEVPPAFAASLAIAAAPEAYVRILILAPEQDEEIIGVLAKGGQGVSFSLGEGSVGIGQAQPLSELVASLVPGLVNAALFGNDLWLDPSMVQLLTGLWEEELDPARALSRAAVIERLKTPEFPQEQAEAFVKNTVASGAVKQDGDQLTIVPALRPWLQALWSGHAVQVEWVPLPAETPLEQAIEGPREHLLFVGPPGQRVLNESVTGEALAAHLRGRQPREESMLHLSALPPDEIARRLRALLRIEGTA